jgi:hypothetical protein
LAIWTEEDIPAAENFAMDLGVARPAAAAAARKYVVTILGASHAVGL